ncbi:MAG: flagellar basal-body MS-ring/collar protein FliF, partial [Deltaproteobacteria bacterium]
IMVPADKVLETRLQLAGEGLPRMNLPPSKNLDNSPRKEAGAADYVQRLNYQRALQDELARTIMQIPQLSYAQVHIAIPKESAFNENEKEPSASVIVKLRGREKLKSGQIKAIVNLVASAVAGLTPSNITVVDTEGHLLHRQEGDQESLLSANQLEYQRRVEEEYRKKVESMLEEVVGVDRAQAQVTAEMDFDRVDTTREDFDPEGQVVRSETLSESDAKRVEPATGPLSGGPQQRNNVTRNYEVSKVTRHVKTATGAIKRLSVAVMVDGNYEKKKGKDGSTLMQYTPRSQQEMENFTRVVKNAIGYNEDRGDQVEVVSVPFANSSITEPSQAFLEKWGSLIDKLAMPLMVLLIAIIALMLVVVRPFFRMHAEKQRQREGLAGPAKEGREVLQEEDLGLAPKKMTDKERIYRLAQSDPDRAADLVRRWLREEM